MTDGRVPPYRIGQGGATTGQLLVWNGTDWAPSADTAAIPKTLVDAKGDLLTATADDTPARLAVGADGLFLKADSSQATGLAWGSALSDPTTTKGDVLARGSSALGRLAVGSDGQVLTADAASTLGVKWAAAGGSGPTIKDRRWNVGSSETSVDEFNDSSLAGAWTRVDASGGTGRATWTEDADVLSVANAGGDAAIEMHAMMQSISSMSAGDGFVTCETLSGPLGSNFSMGGLILANGTTYTAGTQVIGLTYISTAGALNVDCRAFTGYNANSATAGAMFAPFGMIYLRLAMISANTWRHDFSPDGISWIKGTATLSLTLTPTHVGLVSSSWGTAVKSIASFEFLRRVSGVT